MMVFNAIAVSLCYVSAGTLVTGGARIPPGRFVPPYAIIDTQDKADALPPVPQSQAEFARAVIQVNTEFPGAYSMMFGATRCSCGITCCPGDLQRLRE